MKFTWRTATWRDLWEWFEIWCAIQEIEHKAKARHWRHEYEQRKAQSGRGR